MDVRSLYDAFKHAKQTDLLVRCFNDVGIDYCININDFNKRSIMYEAKDAKNTFRQLDKKERLKEKLRQKLNKK